MDSLYKLAHLKDRDTIQAFCDALRADYVTQIAALQARIDLIMSFPLNHGLSAPVLARGTGDAKKIKITNTTTFVAAGVFSSKTTAETVFGADAASVMPISSYTKYLVTLKADGTPHVIQGNNSAAAGTALLPAVPADEAPIGYCQVATDGTHTFTPGTTLLSAAGITDTYADLVWPTSGIVQTAANLGSLVGSTPAAIGALPKYA